MNKKPIAPRLLDENQAAHFLGLSVRTLQKQRCKGASTVESDMPLVPFVRLGSCIRYDIVDLEAFIEACKIAK